MVILEVVVCASLALFWYTERCFYYFVIPIYIEARRTETVHCIGQSVWKVSATLKVSSSEVTKTTKRYNEPGPYEALPSKGRCWEKEDAYRQYFIRWNRFGVLHLWTVVHIIWPRVDLFCRGSLELPSIPSIITSTTVSSWDTGNHEERWRRRWQPWLLALSCFCCFSLFSRPFATHSGLLLPQKNC